MAETPDVQQEVILVADDDVLIRNMIRTMLAAENHLVLDANDGLEALEVARRYSGSIHLLVTDVKMPRMNGIDLVKAIKASRPDIKVLVMSGQTSGETLVRNKDTAFLRKPFIPAVFRTKIRELLSGPPMPAQEI
jgi:two-component system cell cycle sensor histidine kinase/response regulator CckA